MFMMMMIKMPAKWLAMDRAAEVSVCHCPPSQEWLSLKRTAAGLNNNL